jgi:hypothetical protein
VEAESKSNRGGCHFLHVITLTDWVLKVWFSPLRAASMAAMSIFFIVTIASNARLAAARSRIGRCVQLRPWGDLPGQTRDPKLVGFAVHQNLSIPVRECIDAAACSGFVQAPSRCLKPLLRPACTLMAARLPMGPAALSSGRTVAAGSPRLRFRRRALKSAKSLVRCQKAASW